MKAREDRRPQDQPPAFELRSPLSMAPTQKVLVLPLGTTENNPPLLLGTVLQERPLQALPSLCVQLIMCLSAS